VDCLTITTKRLADITADDIRVFVGSGPPESDDFELKQSLPARDGDDRWIRGETHISDRAQRTCRRKLLLGVTESPDHPKRAVGLTPLPRCNGLAVRLRLQIRDCIEPQLTSVEVEGVVTEPDGGGVVAIRVPAFAFALVDILHSDLNNAGLDIGEHILVPELPTSAV
jgi:hypothetical protein